MSYRDEQLIRVCSNQIPLLAGGEVVGMIVVILRWLDSSLGIRKPFNFNPCNHHERMRF